MEGQVNKKDRLYFARIIPSVGIYDVCDVIEERRQTIGLSPVIKKISTPIYFLIKN